MNSSNSFTGNGSHHRIFVGTHYVVSEDVDILLSRWCSEKNLSPPSADSYLAPRAKMKNFLQDIFTRVTFVSSQEIQEGLLASVAKHKEAGLTVISLERAYLDDHHIDGRIEITRSVDDDGRELPVHSVRKGSDPKEIQFNRLRGKNIALVDDVVFSGKTLIETISKLHHYHANVHAVTSAIGVKKGIDNLNNARFCVTGMPDHLTVHCLEEFDGVSDQVCERDFYPGIPFSGREHYLHDKASFPYVLPFGKTQDWASIPEKEVKQFSALCIDNTIALFEEIEETNNIAISCCSVPRPVFGSPKDGTRFVAFLREKRALCV